MVQTLMKVVRETILEIPGLGKRIKQARENDPRSLKEIAAAANMSPMNWYRIESEEQALPEPTLRKIEEVLGVDFEVQFDD
ncbi:helix-turn-helix domain-containing protein [Halotia branconii]|jgi:transcriptional regulator with XRE-family HTH domain|uniref:Helix-turn-helix transcriptional regulator n=1 Tax=Halotia branconii CENA392 TaxID=1539056 RepID=A0AAJ6PCM3_9CYAN|nr:helix-turn-helix transcriptional regulator [Halotia branconii]WGV29129.1 helix-turn-helix transcriptional regulator [Halotia branconii CENA392]